MKNLICFITAIFTISCAIAQDIIIDKEGETTKCKVISITETEVVFRKVDNSLSSLPKSSVMMISYADGRKQTFKAEEAMVIVAIPAETEVKTIATQNSTPVRAAAADSIEVRKKKFYLNGKQIKEKEVREIISNSSCEEALKTLKSRKGNKAFNFIGAGLLGGGIGVVAVTISDFDTNSIPVIIGGAAAAFGLTAMLISSSAMAKKLRTATRQYNSCLQ